LIGHGVFFDLTNGKLTYLSVKLPLMKNTDTLSILLLAILTSFSTLHGQTVHDIITDGGTFSPSTLTIQEGDSVRWMNSEMGFHNVVADDDSFRCAEGCDGDGMGGNGNASGSLWTFTLPFDNAGTVAYYCEIHGGPGGSGMSGTITVEAAPPACTPDLVVTGNPIPSGTYLSMGDLTSQNSTVAGGSTVVFVSDSGVVLQQDFTVELSGNFDAVIQACPSPANGPAPEGVILLKPGKEDKK
jgi:plastocyanin